MTAHISSLQLSWRTRKRRVRGEQPKWLDFVIDGHSLRDMLGEAEYIGCLGWGVNAAYEAELIQQLTLTRPSELETGRRLLYVCPLCGDAGCGAITAVIEGNGDFYVWKDFGLEHNYELDEGAGLFDLTGYEAIGPFRFDKRQYRDALTNWPARG